jgi:hypothetical protein
LSEIDRTFPMNDTIVQGIDWPIVFTFYEDDDVTPKNMAGSLITFTVKPAFDEDDTDAEAYVALETSDFTIDEDPDGPLDGTLNRISAVVPRTTTHDIPVGTHKQDLDIIPAATGYLDTYGRGQLVVLEQSGRRTPS